MTINTYRLPVLFFCFWSISFGLQAQDCNCEDSFDATVAAYESNYSLFAYKVREDNRDIYKAHNRVMRNLATQAEDLKDCERILKQWLGFFRDSHTYLRLRQNQQPYFEQIPITEEKFKLDYQQMAYAKQDILGIWNSGAFTVAIIPNPKDNLRKRDFVGVVLNSTNENWKPGEVKFELSCSEENKYQATYYVGNHIGYNLQSSQPHEGLLTFSGGVNPWKKVWPETEVPEAVVLYQQYHIRMIDDVPYVRFPDFHTKDYTYVDSMVNAHHQELMNADFIVIDIRDNGGGGDYTYFPILRYLLTQAIEIPHVGFWMSEDNIHKMLSERGLLEKPYEDLTEKEQENFDWFISLKDSLYYDHPGVDTYTFKADTVYAGGRKVAILMNENTGSAAETFIYRAKQSENAVLYGQNSGGFVDGFMVGDQNIGCFMVSYPTAIRANNVATHPIDPYGFEPDVYLDKSMDALEFSIQHMKQMLQDKSLETAQKN